MYCSKNGNGGAFTKTAAVSNLTKIGLGLGILVPVVFERLSNCTILAQVIVPEPEVNDVPAQELGYENLEKNPELEPESESPVGVIENEKNR